MNFLRSLLLLTCVVFVFILNSCIKKDEIPPYMRLNGAADTSVLLNSTFQDPWAYAKDETDGLIPVEISGLLNTDSIGVYNRIYLARDGENNSTQLSRIIRVQSELNVWAGTYNVSQFCNVGGSTDYTDAVKPSNTKNDKILLNLGNYSPSYNIEAEIDVFNSTIRVPLQSRLTNQVPIKELQFSSSSGTINSTGFTLTYTIVQVDTSGSMQSNTCNVTYVR